MYGIRSLSTGIGRVLALALAVGVAASPLAVGSAQAQQGGRGGSAPRAPSPEAMESAWDSAKTFAHCVVGMDADQARLMIDQAVLEKDQARRSTGRFLNRFQGCVTGRRGMVSALFYGALAEEVLARRPADAPVPQPGNAEQVTEFIRSIDKGFYGSQSDMPKYQIVAECRAAFAPGQALDVLALDPASEAHANALDVVRALTPQCDALDKDLKRNAYIERAYLALAVYHWSNFSAAAQP
jgi:hypothetical protein